MKETKYAAVNESEACGYGRIFTRKQGSIPNKTTGKVNKQLAYNV